MDRVVKVHSDTLGIAIAYSRLVQSSQHWCLMSSMSDVDVKERYCFLTLNVMFFHKISNSQYSEKRDCASNIRYIIYSLISKCNYYYSP